MNRSRKGIWESMTPNKEVWKSQKELGFQILYTKAELAGIEAAKAIVSVPMTVISTNQTWNVPDGVCGFAYVKIRPGTCAFARWLTKFKGAYRSYYGGIEISIHRYNQSMTRKMAHARAMAHVFCEAGINAHAYDRMD